MARLHDVLLLFVLVFSFVTVDGATTALGDMYIDRIFDAQKFFLATCALLRLIGTPQGEERRFFFLASSALWIGAIINAVRNRAIMQHNGPVWDVVLDFQFPSREWCSSWHLSSSGPTAAVSTISDTHADLA